MLNSWYFYLKFNIETLCTIVLSFQLMIFGCHVTLILHISHKYNNAILSG